MKRCSTCKKDKELDQYNLKKASKDGYGNICKKCMNEYNSLYNFKQYYLDNKEYILHESKTYREQNKEKININNRIYYQQNLEKCKDRIQHYYNTHKEEHKLRGKKWKNNNIYNPQVKLKESLRNRLYNSITKQKTTKSQSTLRKNGKDHCCQSCRCRSGRYGEIPFILARRAGNSITRTARCTCRTIASCVSTRCRC